MKKKSVAKRLNGRIFISVLCRNSSAAVKVTELVTLPSAKHPVVPADDVASYAVVFRGVGINRALSMRSVPRAALNGRLLMGRRAAASLVETNPVELRKSGTLREKKK